MTLSKKRRRRWSVEDKRRIVAETETSGLTVAAVARRHCVVPEQVYAWRKQFRDSALEVSEDSSIPVFLPVAVEPEVPTVDTAVSVEIHLNNGRHLRMSPDLADDQVLRFLRLADAS